jgi:hypothetical protein
MELQPSIGRVPQRTPMCQRRPLRVRPLVPALAAVLFALSACTGSIGGRIDVDEPGGDPTASDGDGVQVQRCPPTIHPVEGQRLTKLEYNNVIRDLFGLQQDFSHDFPEPGTGSAGFTTESSAQTLSPEIVTNFYHSANAVTDAVYASNPNPFLTCTNGDPCATQLITSLATRAFRRPPTEEEVNDLFALYKSSRAPFSEAMKLVVSGILLAPQFIFRMLDNPTTPESYVELTDYELASRISFFLWGSIPDAALLSAAADGSLSTTLPTQVRRMLNDSRSTYLARNFATQWLALGALDAQSRSPERYPVWSPAMQASMKGEVIAFTENVLLHDASVLDFVAANYTFVDENVGQIYGISGTSNFQKVNVDGNRAGVLTQPALLALTSNGDVTSPVRRGKWVLQQLLCSEPPPPPGDVPPLPNADGDAVTGESRIRERLAQHKLQGAECFGCHVAMDPIGLAFEQFDSTGYFRTNYRDGVPVDSSGMLPTGEQLNGVADLSNLLKNDSRFPSCFTSKLSSFALGRDMTTSVDRCSVDEVARAAIGPGRVSSELIIGIVMSDAFRTRSIQ